MQRLKNSKVQLQSATTRRRHCRHQNQIENLQMAALPNCTKFARNPGAKIRFAKVASRLVYFLTSTKLRRRGTPAIAGPPHTAENLHNVCCSRGFTPPVRLRCTSKQRVLSFVRKPKTTPTIQNANKAYPLSLYTASPSVHRRTLDHIESSPAPLIASNSQASTATKRAHTRTRPAIRSQVATHHKGRKLHCHQYGFGVSKWQPTAGAHSAATATTIKQHYLFHKHLVHWANEHLPAGEAPASLPLAQHRPSKTAGSVDDSSSNLPGKATL